MINQEQESLESILNEEELQFFENTGPEFIDSPDEK